MTMTARISTLGLQRSAFDGRILDQALQRVDDVLQGAHGLEGLGVQLLADQRLELHDQVDRVDAVDVQVFVEPRFRMDALGLDVEGLDQDGAQAFKNVFVGHGNSSRSAAGAAADPRRAASAAALCVDELSQRANAAEMATRLFRIGRHADAVALLQGQTQFQCIDRIEAEPVDEQRVLGIDLLRRQVLQIQRVDQQLLDFKLECLHRSTFPVLLKNNRESMRSDAAPPGPAPRLHALKKVPP